jgi:hypothetical protein
MQLCLHWVISGPFSALGQALQSRIGDQEKALSDFKLYVAGHYYASQELNELKRESPTRYATLAGALITFSIPTGTEQA